MDNVILSDESARVIQYCMIQHNPDTQGNLFRNQRTDVFLELYLEYDGSIKGAPGSPIYAVPDTDGEPNKEDADYRVNAIASALFYQYQQ